MDEIWRVVDDAPRYSVSNKGQVRNDKTGRILKPGTNSDGYLLVILARDGLPSINRKIHRLVAIAFIPTDDTSLEVNHNTKTGDKTNNFAENLEWATRSKNQRHAFRNGLYARRGGLIEIIETGQVFETQQEVANAINGHQAAVYRVLNGLQEKHLGYSFRYIEES